MMFTVEYRDLATGERVLLETDDVFQAVTARDNAWCLPHLELVDTNLAVDYRDITVQAGGWS